MERLTDKQIQEKIEYCICNLTLCDAWNKPEGIGLELLLLKLKSEKESRKVVL
jgi:hypothetical protein